MPRILQCLTASLCLTLTLAHPTLEQRQQTDGRFTFYPMKTPAAGPCDLVEGQDGALWGQDILINNIFRIDPQSGQVVEYPIPFTTPISNQTIPGLNNKLIQDRTALSCAIRKGADGKIYFANGLRNQLGRIDPQTKNIQIFQPPVNPAGNLLNFNDLYTADDGIHFTQTTGNVFSFFSFATEQFSSYNVPTPLALPLGLFVASDKKVYIAELLANKILVFDPKTKAINEYALPELAQFPAVVRAERNGWVYFSLFIGNGMGRINMSTHKIEIFHTNRLGLLGAENTIDSQGGVWLSSFNANVLARLDTNTFKYSYVPFPGTLAVADLTGGILSMLPPNVDVPVNYGPGNAIWFASVTRNQVIRYDLS